MKWILFSIFLIVSLPLVAQSGAPSVLPEKKILASDLEQLDSTILRRKLERIHGESGRAGSSKWEVAFGGQIYNWDWNSGWTCPSSKEVLDCSQWSPLSLRWFETKNLWLKPWTQMNKKNILLEADKKIPQSQSTTAPVEGEVIEEPVESEAIRLGGQRLALQAWDWQSNEGKTLRVYTSLRNARVERIDHDGMEEYVEWRQNPKTKSLQIQQIILERDGQRLTARRLEAPAPKKKN
jgi:hypothetical protein